MKVVLFTLAVLTGCGSFDKLRPGSEDQGSGTITMTDDEPILLDAWGPDTIEYMYENMYRVAWPEYPGALGYQVRWADGERDVGPETRSVVVPWSYCGNVPSVEQTDDNTYTVEVDESKCAAIYTVYVVLPDGTGRGKSQIALIHGYPLMKHGENYDVSYDWENKLIHLSWDPAIYTPEGVGEVLRSKTPDELSTFSRFKELAWPADDPYEQEYTLYREGIAVAVLDVLTTSISLNWDGACEPTIFSLELLRQGKSMGLEPWEWETHPSGCD